MGNRSMNQVIELIRKMSKEELHYVYHSSGLERSRKIYRDYYCTYTDDEIANSLVELKLMIGPQDVRPNSWGTDKDSGYYRLTKLGKQIAITIKRGQNSSKSKKMRG